MKKLTTFALASLLVLMLSSCGLVSGTVFITQEVDGSIASSSGSSLDATFGHAVVDFTDNSDWQDYNIEGIEDGCIILDAWNEIADSISGEVWITMDTTNAAIAGINSLQDVEDAGGFIVFAGLALPPGPDVPFVDSPTKHFTCQETLAKLYNVDLLVAALQQGYFVVWGLADQNVFQFTYDGIVFGAHVTGSL